MMHEEIIRAEGHEHVRAEHASTLEVTTDSWLTPAGDCIVGIGADWAPADLERSVTEAARSHDVEIILELEVDDLHATIRGSGHPDLTYRSDRAMVARTSSYVDDRTIMVEADAAAVDLDRALVNRLADGHELQVTLRICE